MARVLGIGGVFFKSNDPGALAGWYLDVLGLDMQDWGGAFITPEGMAAHPGAGTVFSPFPADTTYFASSTRDFMVNLAVDDLDGVLACCAEHGVQPTVLPTSRTAGSPTSSIRTARRSSSGSLGRCPPDLPARPVPSRGTRGSLAPNGRPAASLSWVRSPRTGGSGPVDEAGRSNPAARVHPAWIGEVRLPMVERPTRPVVAAAESGPTESGDQTFGEWLGAQLRARRLTQRQLARKSGVDHSTVSRLVRGDRVPSWSTADRLVRSLGIADGPAGIYRQGPGSTENPAARVEYALRLDDLLGESQVRDIMNVYLTTRLHRPRLVATAGSAMTAPARPASIRRLPTAARRRSS